MTTDHIDQTKTASEINADKVIDTSLDHFLNLKLTKREWITIFNVLLNSPLGSVPSVGNIRAIAKNPKIIEAGLKSVIDIADKIEPYVAQLSSSDIKEEPKVQIN